jgi:hypothetical protein
MIRELTAGAEESRDQKSRMDGDAMGHALESLSNDFIDENGDGT